ncbi:MAG: GTPase HflX [Acidimicrobiia bacterium]
MAEETKYHQARVGKRLSATETDFDVIIQKAVIVAADIKGHDKNVDASLDELELLVDTAGAQVIGREIQSKQSIDSATYIGKGKAQEIAEYVGANDGDLVVFDDELTPAQQRNLEKIMKVDVVDRVGLILDIFAQHATTGEGMAQVELAQLKYLMPRLRGKGSSLSQQGGGIGTRGPGETQLETDRRKIARRMRKLEADLKKLEKVRGTQRKRRSVKPEKRVAIVGYTNAGKSSLLNVLAKSNAHVEDRLFATLAPTTKQVFVGHDENAKPMVVLCSDTVGFVTNLPHQLVEAFRSTLDEAKDADLLLHVVDSSSDQVNENIDAVNSVLKEIGAEDIDQILVWNKLDLLDQDQLEHIKNLDHDLKREHIIGSDFISTVDKSGIEQLRNSIQEYFSKV